MELKFDLSLAENYKSPSQRARVLTEAWVGNHMFCPRCGHTKINRFSNNQPVADFFCPACNNEYELKSKKGRLGNKINDGAYSTMIKRITSNSNPDFFFMDYSQKEVKVNNLILIPKHFFVPEIIEKRKPLSDTAKRAGWVGCNILIHMIPIQGRIEIIRSGKLLDKEQIIRNTNRSQMLKINNINSRGWLMDILRCVNQMPFEEFGLDGIYKFEQALYKKHPDNKNIKAKIRQQLQFLRDKGYIQFVDRGKYKKIKWE